MAISRNPDYPLFIACKVTHYFLTTQLFYIFYLHFSHKLLNFAEVFVQSGK